MNNAPTSSANRQIARAAGTVMFAFILSNLTGLVRQILQAGTFGTGAEIEAFNAANRMAETLFTLVAGGALSSAFIPTFTGMLAKEDRDGAWRMASAIANLLLLILIGLSLLGMVFAPQIVRHILAPGFADQPAKEALTIALTRLMLPSAILFGLSGLVMGILNSHQVFLVPALTPSMYQIGMIFGMLVLSPRLGIFGLGWGVLIGAALHLGLQLPALVRQQARYTPTLGIRLASVREVIRLMGPRLLGVAIVQINFLVNVNLASGMVEGSVTSIALAFSLMLMPQAAIAQSIAIAAMPTFSKQAALGQLDEMRASLAASLRWVLLLSVPASIGLMLLRRPLVALLYQRGEFTARSTELVAWALLWFAVGLVGHSLVEILARAFYSLHDTRTPVVVGTVAMSLNVLFSLLFSALFRQAGALPHGGLALANSTATALEMVGLLYLMRRRLSGLQGHEIASSLMQAGLAAALMAVAVWGWMRFTAAQPNWIILGGAISVGAAVYAVGTLLLGVKEVRSLMRAVRTRLIR